MAVIFTAKQRQHLLAQARADHGRALSDLAVFGSVAVDPGDPWQLFHRLPPCTFGQSAEWRGKFACSFDCLAGDLASDRLPHPRTTAEQLALRLMIEDACGRGTSYAFHDHIGATTIHRDNGAWAAVTGAVMNRHAVAAFYDPQLVETWLNFFPLDSWFHPIHPIDPG